MNTPHYYWFRYLKRRGYTYGGMPSKKQAAKDVCKLLDGEDRSFSKKEADKYMIKKKKKRIAKRKKINEISEGGCAYLIGSRDLKYVKIGYSRKLTDRITAIQNSCPFDIEILAIVTSHKPRKTEKKLHYKFSGYKIRGEWFNLTEEIEAFIEEVNS